MWLVQGYISFRAMQLQRGQGGREREGKGELEMDTDRYCEFGVRKRDEGLRKQYEV